eukprot:gene7432-9134_t
MSNNNNTVEEKIKNNEIKSDLLVNKADENDDKNVLLNSISPETTNTSAVPETVVEISSIKSSDDTNINNSSLENTTTIEVPPPTTSTTTTPANNNNNTNNEIKKDDENGTNNEDDRNKINTTTTTLSPPPTRVNFNFDIPKKPTTNNVHKRMLSSSKSMPSLNKTKYLPLTTHLNLLDDIKKVSEIDDPDAVPNQKELVNHFVENKPPPLPPPEKLFTYPTGSDSSISSLNASRESINFDDTSSSSSLSLSTSSDIIKRETNFITEDQQQTNSILDTTITIPTNATPDSTSMTVSVTEAKPVLVDGEEKPNTNDTNQPNNDSQTTQPPPQPPQPPPVSPMSAIKDKVVQAKKKIVTFLTNSSSIKESEYGFSGLSNQPDSPPLPDPSPKDGHLFIVHGDLTKFVCDVKMVPCGPFLDPLQVAISSWLRPDWEQFPINLKNKILDNEIKRLKDRVHKIEDWPTHYPNISQPWFVNVVPCFNSNIKLQPEWYIQGAREFLDKVGEDLRRHLPPIKNGRSKYLVSLPIVGTGGGGGSNIAGSILSLLIHELYVATRKWRFDIVLVTNEISMYTAAINKRQEMMLNNPTFSYTYDNILGTQYLQKAKVLAKLIDEGQLALFIGAGASRSAGLPTWNGLLQLLGEKLGMTEEEIKTMEQLHHLDRATILENRWVKALEKYSPSSKIENKSTTNLLAIHKSIYKDVNVPMQTEIANLMKVHNAGLPHFILASTQVQEIITTNYDQCFEIASKSIEKPVCVLPYENNRKTQKRWILKLHGCVTHPSDIILTREDYLRYSDKKEALAGIVQASLITKHLLFVGFSLVDDNFYQIMSTVKRADTNRDKSEKYGTALFIQRNDLMNELWGKELDILCFDEDGKGDIAQCARKQEIFLEYLASISINKSNHLMEKRFECLLSKGEKVFRDSLIDFVEGLPVEAKGTKVYKKFEKFLLEIGMNPRLLTSNDYLDSISSLKKYST